MDPDLTLRTVRDEEFLDYARAMDTVFLEASSTDEQLERWRGVCPPERFLTVADGHGAHVATAGSLPLTISWPGTDTVLGCAGVTAVTVRPDHRRRGLLRTMMQRLLDDAVAAGETVATLYASEGTIYGRFGFGAAVPIHGLRVRRGALATVPGDPGLVELVDAARAKQLFPEIAEAHGRVRSGFMGRDAAWWSMWLDHADDPDGNRGYGARWHAVVPGRGYAAFRGTDGSWENRRPSGRLRVTELVANDREATAALWAFLASVDLVETVVAPHRPVDDPLRFLLANEAELDVRANLPLWLRLVDLPAALSTRGYEVADRLVLDVHDDQLPANAGRWSLDVGPDGASCTRTDDAADVVLSTSTLATLVLGGFRATTLAEAGRLPGTAPADVRRLDRLFDVPRAPWTAFDF